MVPDSPRRAGLPGTRQASPLGFPLIDLHPHQRVDQVRDLKPSGTQALAVAPRE